MRSTLLVNLETIIGFCQLTIVTMLYIRYPELIQWTIIHSASMLHHHSSLYPNFQYYGGSASLYLGRIDIFKKYLEVIHILFNLFIFSLMSFITFKTSILKWISCWIEMPVGILYLIAPMYGSCFYYFSFVFADI